MTYTAKVLLLITITLFGLCNITKAQIADTTIYVLPSTDGDSINGEESFIADSSTCSYTQ